MNYIRNSYTRAFQNTQNYYNPIYNDGERAKYIFSIFFYQKLDVFLGFPGDLRSGNDVCSGMIAGKART